LPANAVERMERGAQARPTPTPGFMRATAVRANAVARTKRGGRARGGAMFAVAVALIVAGAGCVGGINCEPTVGAPEAIFEGTVVAVADDGSVQFTVESVTPPTTLNTTTVVVGEPTTTVAPVLATVTAGATVTVAFPVEQVEHLRRDLGERYRVRAWPDDTGGALRSQLNDFENKCAPTKLADE